MAINFCIHNPHILRGILTLMPQAITETLRRHITFKPSSSRTTAWSILFHTKYDIPTLHGVQIQEVERFIRKSPGAVIDAGIQLLAFKSPTFTVPKDVTVDSRLRGNDKAVILANAGIQLWLLSHSLLKHPKTLLWIPAFAGMTKELESYCGFPPPTRE
ncbi:hypothetical protein Sputw3181_1480 [Shewanella sp. W3-18-1]|nr:hypothetical protein Sputw3181_1480 [Shewanella sp. W3-18-1]